MKAIKRAINQAFETKEKRGWDTIYWLVDVHGTIIKSTYNREEDFAETYDNCLWALGLLSKRKDCKIILWTSSYNDYVDRLIEWLKERNVTIDYFNENPECENTEAGDFSKKFYFNVIIDDKAGFDPENDWIEVVKALSEARRCI